MPWTCSAWTPYSVNLQWCSLSQRRIKRMSHICEIQVYSILRMQIKSNHNKPRKDRLKQMLVGIHNRHTIPADNFSTHAVSILYTQRGRAHCHMNSLIHAWLIIHPKHKWESAMNSVNKRKVRKRKQMHVDMSPQATSVREWMNVSMENYRPVSSYGGWEILVNRYQIFPQQNRAPPKFILLRP